MAKDRNKKVLTGAVFIATVLLFTFYVLNIRAKSPLPAADLIPEAMKSEGLKIDDPLKETAADVKKAEFSAICETHRFRHYTLTVSSAPLQILQFENADEARRARQILKDAGTYFKNDYYIRGPFVLQLRYWRYKKNGSRVIGVEEINIDEEIPEKISRALQRLRFNDN